MNKEDIEVVDRISFAMVETFQRAVRKEGGIDDIQLEKILRSVIMSAVCASNTVEEARKILHNLFADTINVFEHLPEEYRENMEAEARKYCLN